MSSLDLLDGPAAGDFAAGGTSKAPVGDFVADVSGDQLLALKRKYSRGAACDLMNSIVRGLIASACFDFIAPSSPSPAATVFASGITFALEKKPKQLRRRTCSLHALSETSRANFAAHADGARRTIQSLQKSRCAGRQCRKVARIVIYAAGEGSSQPSSNADITVEGQVASKSSSCILTFTASALQKRY